MARKEPQIEFKNKHEKLSAAENLQNLKNHPGWQLVVEYFKRKEVYLNKVINGDIANDDGSSIIQNIEDLRYFRNRRNALINFIELPDILIDQNNIDNAEPISFDPYEEYLTDEKKT